MTRHDLQDLSWRIIPEVTYLPKSF
jgi:hypothetical protein